MNLHQSQRRNFLKQRLSNLSVYPDTPLTESEKRAFDAIIEIKNDLLYAWDSSTEDIRGKPLPKYKCRICGKRTNKEYRIPFVEGSIDPKNDIFVCRKHYLQNI